MEETAIANQLTDITEAEQLAAGNGGGGDAVVEAKHENGEQVQVQVSEPRCALAAISGGKGRKCCETSLRPQS